MWLTGYSYRKKITIDATKIDTTLTDLPVLVKLTNANFDFTKARSDGYDIRFTESDGETLLKYERERHDDGSELAEYWIKVPSISSSVDTDIYIYYGKADASDGENTTNVWDSNFKAVWHMNDLTASTIEDSTSNNHDGNKGGADNPAETDAKIAKGQDFDGNDSVLVPNHADWDFGTDDFTIEFCLYYTGTLPPPSEGRGLIATTNTPSQAGWWSMIQTATTKVRFGKGGSGAIVISDTDVSGSTWHQLVVVRD